VTRGLRDRGIGSVLLDIEGTTTPIAFVYDVLFPYARANVDRLLRERIASADVTTAVQRLAAEWHDDVAAGNAPPEWRSAADGADPDAVSRYVVWLMDRDRKSPGLKSLQGLVWEAGYRAGLLQGAVFDDVPRAMASWRRAGIDVAIYSSGSVLAQRLLFGSTRFGDLTGSISAFFDTAVGPKTSPDSYRRIADALKRRPSEILFVSDIAAELDAARTAGYQVTLSIRPGNPSQQVIAGVSVVHSFDEIAT
jgi:enolase-phosphatase E1